MTTEPDDRGEEIAAGPDARPAILVVDDDPAALFTMREVLADLGAEVVVASAGAEALRQVLQRDFALIFLDVRMPDMDGYEVAAAIRQREKSRRIPLIFLTAIASEETQVFRGYEAGAVDYIFKPLDPHVLRSKALVFIELYRQAEEIRCQMEQEKRLLEENLRIRAAMLEAERRLRSSQAREALVIRALPIALYEAEPRTTGPRRFINDNARRLMGFAASEFELAPQHWMERIHPDDVAAVKNTLARGGDYTMEYRWRCADGAYRYFGDHGVTIEGSGSEPPRVVGAMLDQHDGRMLEQQLLHAQKMDAIGKLTGGIAHDFNNMLTVIISGLEWALRQETLPEGIGKRLGSAFQGALRCADLTERLLGFARNQPLLPVPLCLNSVVHGLAELLDRTFGRGVQITFDLAGDLWPVFADRVQMESAVMNLLVNARDAMPEGGNVTLRTFNTVSPEARALPARLRQEEFVVLEVADTGTGMPEEVLMRAVEPFFTTKEVGQGTGLGLSTIYGFVKKSGGELLIDSKVGQGTCVRICMPRSPAIAEVAPGPPHPADADEPSAAGQGRTVLIVEDDVDVLAATAKILRELGYHVMETTKAEDALRLLRGPNRVDLLFADLMLRGQMNGHQLGQQAVARSPELRVLYTSGYAGGVCEKPENVQPFLKKPYRDHELARAVAEALAAPPPAASPPALKQGLAE